MIKDIDEGFEDIMKLTVCESAKEVDGTLCNLYDDGYKIIWTNENYVFPQPAEVQITRAGVSVSLKVDRHYKMTISYEELERYYVNRVNASPFISDMFHQLFDDSRWVKRLATGRGFVSDNTTLVNTNFGKDGVIIYFKCTNVYDHRVKPSDFMSVSQQQSDDIQIKFEGQSEVLGELSSAISKAMQLESMPIGVIT